MDEKHKIYELYPYGVYPKILDRLEKLNNGNWSFHSDCECFKLEVYKSFGHRANREIIPLGKEHSMANPDIVTGNKEKFLGLDEIDELMFKESKS